MIVHPHPDPVAIEIFGLNIHWYGIMYLVGFIIAWGIARYLIRLDSFSSLRGIILEDFIVAAAIGVVIGGRLGYVLFYNPSYYAEQPLEIFNLAAGGMSFHGGLAGVIVSLWVLARIHAISNVRQLLEEENRDQGDQGGEQYDQRDAEILETVTSQQTIFLRLVDFAAVVTPPGLGLGRLGNFINAELPGRVTSADLPWAMSFGYPDYLPRHPSQLYQFFIEGIILTALMLYLSRRQHPPGWLAGVFLIAYAIGRFSVEFYREPDAHLGLLFLNLSMGQLLSIPLLLIGLALVYRLKITAWRQGRGDTALTLKQRLQRMLTAEPDVTWSEHEKLFAENYGEDNGEVEEGSRFGRLLKGLFGGSEEEEVEYISSRIRLTRQEKRRLKKKKRKR